MLFGGSASTSSSRGKKSEDKKERKAEKGRRFEGIHRLIPLVFKRIFLGAQSARVVLKCEMQHVMWNTTKTYCLAKCSLF